MKTFLVSISILLSSLYANADQTDIKLQAGAAVTSIDRYLKLKKDFPNRDQSQALRKTQRDVLIFNNALSAKTPEASERFKLEANIDYYADECERNKSIATLCKAAETQTAKYKKDYQADYKPKKPVYPEINLEKYIYSLGDKSYDLKNLKYVTAPAAAKVTAVPEVVASTSATTKVEPTEKNPEYECEWDKSLPPRKLLYAPGCSGKEKLCTGYVKCNKNGWKINRLATCGDEFCTDSTATECAKQKTYGSKTSKAETPEIAEVNVEAKDIGVSNGK